MTAPTDYVAIELARRMAEGRPATDVDREIAAVLTDLVLGCPDWRRDLTFGQLRLLVHPAPPQRH